MIDIKPKMLHYIARPSNILVTDELYYSIDMPVMFIIAHKSVLDTVQISQTSETAREDVFRSGYGCNDFGWRTIGSPACLS